MRSMSIACNLRKSEVTALALASKGRQFSRRAARVLRELELLDNEDKVQSLGLTVLGHLGRFQPVEEERS